MNRRRTPQPKAPWFRAVAARRARRKGTPATKRRSAWRKRWQASRRLKTTVLRRVSPRRAAERAIYHQLRTPFLSLNPWCAVCGKMAKHVHHSRYTSNKMLNIVRWWVPVCRKCHRRIHDNPAWARTQFWNGIPLLCQRGDYLKP